ncbi:MAG: MmcQ/YjbR family DNA-binding protein [Gracilibacteraceae bacterium]|jgi:predicted DNA-binding protein (MmcQ/YjbR family)|nr:MmcQ/YjbR family DNA-binding protein [Gracilibacteraceae bacterium]
MTRREVIEYCLTFLTAYEDYPFDVVVDDNAATVMRHKGNKKSFALIMRHGGDLYLNLKCHPFDGDFLRDAFESVIPGYHMNKNHWITVVLDKGKTEQYVCDVPDDLIRQLVGQSYNLIKPKMRSSSLKRTRRAAKEQR